MWGKEMIRERDGEKIREGEIYIFLFPPNLNALFESTNYLLITY